MSMSEAGFGNLEQLGHEADIVQSRAACGRQHPFHGMYFGFEGFAALFHIKCELESGSASSSPQFWLSVLHLFNKQCK